MYWESSCFSFYNTTVIIIISYSPIRWWWLRILAILSISRQPLHRSYLSIVGVVWEGAHNNHHRYANNSTTTPIPSFSSCSCQISFSIRKVIFAQSDWHCSFGIRFLPFNSVAGLFAFQFIGTVAGWIDGWQFRILLNWCISIYVSLSRGQCELISQFPPNQYITNPRIHQKRRQNCPSDENCYRLDILCGSRDGDYLDMARWSGPSVCELRGRRTRATTTALELDVGTWSPRYMSPTIPGLPDPLPSLRLGVVESKVIARTTTRQ